MEQNSLIIALELIVALVATVTYYKYRHNNLRYFLWYTWIILLVEVVAARSPDLIQPPSLQTNIWIYNILVIIEFPLLVFWYRSFLENGRSRQVLKYLILLYIAFAMVNSMFIQSSWDSFMYFNFIWGAITLIVAIILYFIEVLHTEKVLIINRGLLFWVSVGFLFFYASVIPIMVMGNVLNYSAPVYNAFLLILNIILHISFLIGLLWGQKKYN